MLGRRRPLLRAAAVGGGAYALGKRRARMEQEEADANYYAGQQDAAASSAGSAGSGGGAGSAGAYEELQRLAQLKEQGILTEAEFEVQKAKILAS